MRETTYHRTSPPQSYKQTLILPLPESKTMLTQQDLLPNATKEPKHEATSKEQGQPQQPNIKARHIKKIAFSLHFALGHVKKTRFSLYICIDI